MDCPGAPSKTWFLCLLYVVFLLIHTALEAPAWQTPIKSCFGHTPDLLPLLQFKFYKLVYYLDHKASFPKTREHSGQFVGIAENKGNALTYWILNNDNQLLARSVVQSATGQEPNKCGSKSIESKGSNVPDPTSLDLMSDLVGGSTDFDPIPHLGYSFVWADTNGIPHKTTVINVDEKTGCILLEYIHGQVEWVEPNILQEALFSHADNDNSSDFWTFGTVLDHKTENNQVQVQIKWDNSNITWEPLNSLRKNETLAKYAHDKGITNKRRWKWSCKLNKQPQKLLHMLHINAGQKAAANVMLNTNLEYKF